ncbi:unnamed protein product [Tilletia controversa]|nr:unnamed protein product [Tilletia controversa]
MREQGPRALLDCLILGYAHQHDRGIFPAQRSACTGKATSSPSTSTGSPESAASQQNIKSLYSISYYSDYFQICLSRDPLPGKDVDLALQNKGLGSVLMGDGIYNSPMAAQVP